MAKVHFPAREDCLFAVRFAYDPILVELVKALPWSDRRWNPALREWRVHGSRVHSLAARMRELDYAVTGVPTIISLVTLDSIRPDVRRRHLYRRSC